MLAKSKVALTVSAALLAACCVLVWVIGTRGCRADKTASSRDICYPDLPKQFWLPPAGPKVTLLAQADSLSSVVGWAERNLKYNDPTFTATGSNELRTQCFIVLYMTGSGLANWCYLAYVPEFQAGKQNWYLLCSGFADATAGWDIVDYPRINGKKGTLEFAAKDGKTTRSVNIKRPLAALRKHLGTK